MPNSGGTAMEQHILLHISKFKKTIEDNLKDLYKIKCKIMGLFGNSVLDDAKKLFANGKYQECINKINGNISVISLFRSLSKELEEHWLLAQCHFKLGEYSSSMIDINYIKNYPDSGSVSNKYRSLARELEKQIVDIQNRLSQESVRYPVKTFLEFVSPNNKSCKIEEKVYEGLSKEIGNYYVRYSCAEQDSMINTIYIKPVTSTSIEIFIYLEYIDLLLERKKNDTIFYNVMINKFPVLKTLIEKGKNGSNLECSVFCTTDYARETTTRNQVPVLGVKCNVGDSQNCSYEECKDALKVLFDGFEILSIEANNTNFSNLDFLIIGIIALIKGGTEKIVGKEIGEPLLSAFAKMF